MAARRIITVANDECIRFLSKEIIESGLLWRKQLLIMRDFFIKIKAKGSRNLRAPTRNLKSFFFFLIENLPLDENLE